ncbi:hypothetical protein AK812_SmicGene11920 [Symbiodinium microadriaticum]|uniref:Uncharacterized protein n=1 Tax=Symbiodinium microadriaticum TaxID=2951 RepID=A0A1Q9EBZ3_SYMMI|nr:hypothetical protein AK812_SmicGene11920 [Symbiodinium microadriaticum]
MDANGPLHSEVITALRSVTVSCQATQTLAASEATLKGADLTDPSCEDAFAAEATPTRKQAVLKKKRKKPPVQRKGAQDEVCVLEHQQATKLPSQLLDTQISNLLDVDGPAELDSTPVPSSTSSPASPKKVRMDAGYHSSLAGSQDELSVQSTSPAEAAKQEKHAKEKTVEETEVSLRHGKFITEGSVQDFVYIPARSTMDLAAKSSELFDTILRHWNLQRPYLLIKFQSGFAHPKHLLDAEELRKLENKHMDSEIYKYYMHFRNFVSYQEKVNAEEEGQELDREKREQIIRERTLELLNEFLYKSLSNLIDVIVRACVRNRCWILVEGGPNGGLLLLKQAAERCNERPTVLVLDSLKKKRYPYREVKKFIEEEKELQSKLKVQTLEQLALRGAKPDEVGISILRPVLSSIEPVPLAIITKAS